MSNIEACTYERWVRGGVSVNVAFPVPVLQIGTLSASECDVIGQRPWSGVKFQLGTVSLCAAVLFPLRCSKLFLDEHL